MSGTAGIDPGTNQLPGLTIQAQTRQALINCENPGPIAVTAGTPPYPLVENFWLSKHVATEQPEGPHIRRLP